MSSYKFKRGQESKVSSLAKEDGSLIFSLNGANDSTLRMDAAISGTVQRLGIAVDKAKSADNSAKLGGFPLTSDKKYFEVVPFIRNDGVMEVGKYFDFHTTSNSAADYNVRLVGEDNKLTVTGAAATTVVAGRFDGLATSANHATNASTASFASVAGYPQGFSSRTTSATWGNTGGTFITGWHTSSGGDIAFMNDNPASGQVSMKLDGYFYQREGNNRVLDTADGETFVKKAGDTMTGTLTLSTGNQKGVKLGSAWMTAASNTNGEFVLQGGHLRFGTSAWDYNQWAGLKYDHSKKAVYLGIADGSIFLANSGQSGGSLFTPGISNLYVGASTSTRVLTSTDGAGYVKKSGDTMTGALNFANNTWNLVGDDVKIGDHNIGGGLGILGNNGNTRIDWCKYGDASKYQSIVYDGTKLATGGTFKADYFEGLAQSASSASLAATANTAKTISPFENATANAARNVWFSDSATRNKPCYNDNFKYNPVTNLLTANISGSAAKWTTARTVTANGDIAGSFSLDGSVNVSAGLYLYNCRASVGNTNNYPYHRIAKLDTITGSWVDKSSLLYISQDYNGGFFGIVRVSLRTNNAANTQSSVEVKWLVRQGFSADAIQIGHYKVAGKTYADVFYRSNSGYASCVIRDLGSGSRGNIGRTWTLVSSSEANDTTTSDKKSSSECWASIAAAGSALHGQAYSEIINGSDSSTVAYANNSGALGGSSLSQVLASGGGGQAFTGLDTTTNNVVKLTRANGGTVQKTINNVSNASSASYATSAASAASATNASTANYAKSAPPTANSVNYVRVYNSANIGNSNTVTVNDLSKKHFAQGMINSATDNPLGKAGWVHVQSMAWADGTDQWASQIAFDVQNGTGAYYRSSANSGHLAGRAWNKFLDSANYTNYAADRTALSGASVSNRTITFTRANGSTFSITTQDNNTIYPVYGRTLSSTFANGFRKETYGSANNGWYLAAIRNNTANVFGAPQHGSGIGWGSEDTHGYLYVSYSAAEAYLGGGNAGKLNWQKRIAFTDSKVASASSADNASKLGGLPSTDYALKSQLSGDINALTAKRLPSFSSKSIGESFFYRHGTPGVTDTADWENFPSTYLAADASTENGFGNGMYKKSAGVLHLAAGTYTHDLVFQAGGTNDGVVYAGSGRKIAYLLDTQNYKSRGNSFNALTATSLSVSSSNIELDGGSY